MADKQYGIDQFGFEIKDKYPAYKDKGNADLSVRILSKYPVYRSKLTEDSYKQLAPYTLSFMAELAGKRDKAEESELSEIRTQSSNALWILSKSLGKEITNEEEFASAYEQVSKSVQEEYIKQREFQAIQQLPSMPKDAKIGAYNPTTYEGLKDASVRIDEANQEFFTKRGVPGAARLSPTNIYTGLVDVAAGVVKTAKAATTFPTRENAEALRNQQLMGGVEALQGAFKAAGPAIEVLQAANPLVRAHVTNFGLLHKYTALKLEDTKYSPAVKAALGEVIPLVLSAGINRGVKAIERRLTPLPKTTTWNAVASGIDESTGPLKAEKVSTLAPVKEVKPAFDIGEEVLVDDKLHTVLDQKGPNLTVMTPRGKEIEVEAKSVVRTIPKDRRKNLDISVGEEVLDAEENLVKIVEHGEKGTLVVENAVGERKTVSSSMVATAPKRQAQVDQIALDTIGTPVAKKSKKTSPVPKVVAKTATKQIKSETIKLDSEIKAPVKESSPMSGAPVSTPNVSLKPPELSGFEFKGESESTKFPGRKVKNYTKVNPDKSTETIHIYDDGTWRQIKKDSFGNTQEASAPKIGQDTLNQTITPKEKVTAPPKPKVEKAIPKVETIEVLAPKPSPQGEATNIKTLPEAKSTSQPFPKTRPGKRTPITIDNAVSFLEDMSVDELARLQLKATDKGRGKIEREINKRLGAKADVVDIPPESKKTKSPTASILNPEEPKAEITNSSPTPKVQKVEVIPYDIPESIPRTPEELSPTPKQLLTKSDNIIDEFNRLSAEATEKETSSLEIVEPLEIKVETPRVALLRKQYNSLITDQAFLKEGANGIDILRVAIKDQDKSLPKELRFERAVLALNHYRAQLKAKNHRALLEAKRIITGEMLPEKKASLREHTKKAIRNVLYDVDDFVISRISRQWAKRLGMDEETITKALIDNMPPELQRVIEKLNIDLFARRSKDMPMSEVNPLGVYVGSYLPTYGEGVVNPEIYIRYRPGIIQFLSSIVTDGRDNVFGVTVPHEIGHGVNEHVGISTAAILRLWPTAVRESIRITPEIFLNPREHGAETFAIAFQNFYTGTLSPKEAGRMRRVLQRNPSLWRIVGHLEGMGAGKVSRIFKNLQAARSVDGVLRFDQMKNLADQENKHPSLARGERDETGFFSGLQRAVDRVPMKVFTGQQLLGMLSKIPGVKESEIQWTGLREWLATKPKATKEEVQQFLKENEVKITVKELSDKPIPPIEWKIEPDGLSSENFTIKKNPNEPGYILTSPVNSDPNSGVWNTEHANLQEARDAAEYANKQRVSENAPQHADPALLLPGPRSNNREILLQYEDKNVKPNKLADNGYPDDMEVAFSREDVFTQSHYPEVPNVVAHIRANDRTDVTTAKALHVEEFQSDWNKAYRKEGFVDPEIRKKIDRLINARSLLENKRITAFTKDSSGQFQRNDLLLTQLQGAINKVEEKIQALSASPGFEGVPRAPFVAQGWHELAFKKALFEAVKGGYDKLTWTTGEQQINRYKLSKHLTAINYLKNPNDTYNVVAVGRNNEAVYSTAIASNKRLEEVFGRDLANKITASEKTQGQISGLDLDIGGEWASNLYDKMLPEYANKFTKKWGARVEQTELLSGTAERQIVHSLTITPEMRASIQEQGGVPLFAKGKRDIVNQKRSNIKKIEDTIDAQEKDTRPPFLDRTKVWLADWSAKYNDKLRSINDQANPFEQLFLPDLLAKYQERIGRKPTPDESAYIMGRLATGGSGGLQEVGQYLFGSMAAEAHLTGLERGLKGYLNLRTWRRAADIVDEKFSAANIKATRLQTLYDSLARDVDTGRTKAKTGARKMAVVKGKLDKAKGDVKRIGNRIKTNKVIPNGITRAELTQMEIDFPNAFTPKEMAKIKDLSQRVPKNLGRMWEGLHEEGVISDAMYAIGNSRGDYFPIHRIRTIVERQQARYGSNALELRTQKVVRELEGSARTNLDPITNALMVWQEAAREIWRNKTARTLIENWTRLDPNGFGKVIKQVKQDTKPAEGMGVVAYFKNGKPTYWEVPDFVANTLKTIGPMESSIINKTMRAVAYAFKLGTTLANPAFFAGNIPRDISESVLLSKKMGGPIGTAKLMVTWVKALKSVITRDPEFIESLVEGVQFSTSLRAIAPERAIAEYRAPLLSKQRAEIIGREVISSPLKAPITLAKASFNAVLDLGAAFEEATKLAHYNRLRKLGFTKVEAAWEARNFGGSPDFGHTGYGSSEANLVFMYLNAQIKSTTRVFARMMEDPKKAMLLFGSATATALFLQSHNLVQTMPDGSNSWEHIPQFDRDNYLLYIYPNEYEEYEGALVPKVRKLTNPTAFKLFYGPIVVGLTDVMRAGKLDNPGNIIQNTLDSIDGGNIARNVVNNLSPGQVNLEEGRTLEGLGYGIGASTLPLLHVPLEIMAGPGGQQFYRGGQPIEPRRLQSPLGAQLAHDPSTSITARRITAFNRWASDRILGRMSPEDQQSALEKVPVLGRALARPKYMEHAIRSFAGGVGEYLTNTADYVQGQESITGQHATGDAKMRQNPLYGPIVRRFITTPQDYQEKLMERKFYERAEDIRGVLANYNKLLIDNEVAADAYMEPELIQEMLAISSAVAESSKMLAFYRREQESISSDKSLTTEQYNQIVSEIHQEKVQYLKGITEDMDEALARFDKKSQQ